MAGFVNRENRVPHYQRLFQKHDGIRQWNKTPRSRAILMPYYAMLWGGFAASMYMMGRQVLGKKTWY
ncbi:transcription factor c6 [Diplodia corticola]|uniref:Transcription factor c6 n=1 Tax=Diplodia corticola TaxID=236234 RepID=A0A1J9QQY5_9PEZI|nr:transcription factor c6 [Diplodia corticola]OJD31350.1 transcription factor c6 [Diplodia corticola]